MSKHTTRPKYRPGAGNSHTHEVTRQLLGNWNSHKKRRMPSRDRTIGRMARFCVRHPNQVPAHELEWAKLRRGVTA